MWLVENMIEQENKPQQPAEIRYCFYFRRTCHEQVVLSQDKVM